MSPVNSRPLTYPEQDINSKHLIAINKKVLKGQEELQKQMGEIQLTCEKHSLVSSAKPSPREPLHRRPNRRNTLEKKKTTQSMSTRIPARETVATVTTVTTVKKMHSRAATRDCARTRYDSKFTNCNRKHC
ncbi:unnamed protein product [Caenorhabditis brenneri]